MEKYVKVSWPESQDWMAEEYEGEVIQASDEHTIYTFVPEELYNEENCIKDYALQARRRIERACAKNDLSSLKRSDLEDLVTRVYGDLLEATGL